MRSTPDLSLAHVARRFLQPENSRFLLFLLVSQVSVHIAAPFFTPYMLAHLKFSYGEYVVLVSASYLSKVLLYPYISRLVQGLGAYRTLWVAGIFVAPMPIFWFLTPSLPALCAIQVVAGFMWGAFELASMLLIFQRISAHERIRILTLYNVLNATAVVSGSLLGGVVLASYTKDVGYAAIFSLSAAARLLSLGVLMRAGSVKVRFRQLYLRTVALRPGGRSPLEQPILTEEPPAFDEAGK